jgi:type I restriction enzyme S subunit
MTDVFDTTTRPTDKCYLLIRDHPDCRKQRQFLVDLWQKYEPLADSHFRSQLACDFHARFWEMYLACALLEQGLTLARKNRSGGPDICIESSDGRIWIEATAPGPGTGPDALHELEIPAGGLKKAFGIPDREIILRYRSAIQDKHKQYLKYRELGLVSDTEPFVVGVYGGRVPLSAVEPDLPLIVKALFALGDWTVTTDLASGEMVSKGYAYRPQIMKKKGGASFYARFSG